MAAAIVSRDHPRRHPPGLDPLRRDRRLVHRGDVRPGPDPPGRLRRLGRPPRRTTSTPSPSASTCPSATPTSPCAAASWATSSARSSTPRWACSPTWCRWWAAATTCCARRSTSTPSPRGSRMPWCACATTAPTCCSRHPPTPATPGCSSRCAAGTRAHGQPVHHRPAARLLRAQPVGHGRPARLADVGRGPDPPHRRGTSPGGAGSAHRARPPHRPGRLDHPAAAGRPGHPRRGAARPRGVGPHLRRAVGAATAAGPLVRRHGHPKRPQLEHFRDPEGEPDHQALPEG